MYDFLWALKAQSEGRYLAHLSQNRLTEIVLFFYIYLHQSWHEKKTKTISQPEKIQKTPPAASPQQNEKNKKEKARIEPIGCIFW